MSTDTTSFAYAWAQTTGTAHISRGVPCEDSMGLATVTDSSGTAWLVAAVADGAGSAACAQDGSRLAIDSFVGAAVEDLLQDGAWDLATLVRTSAVFAQAMLSFVAEASERPIADFHTTLLGCVSNGVVSAFLQIGDGVIAVREQLADKDAEWKLVFPPQNGEERHLTFFLTLPDASEHLQVSVIEAPLTHVVLLTDGLQDVLVRPAAMTVHPPLFDRLAIALASSEGPGHAHAISRGLHAVLDSEVMRRFTGDDTSLLAVRLRS